MKISKKEYSEIRKIIELGANQIIVNTLRYNKIFLLTDDPKNPATKIANEIKKKAKLYQRTALLILKENIE